MEKVGGEEELQNIENLENEKSVLGKLKSICHILLKTFFSEM